MLRAHQSVRIWLISFDSICLPTYVYNTSTHTHKNMPIRNIGRINMLYAECSERCAFVIYEWIKRPMYSNMKNNEITRLTNSRPCSTACKHGFMLYESWIIIYFMISSEALYSAQIIISLCVHWTNESWSVGQ